MQLLALCKMDSEGVVEKKTIKQKQVYVYGTMVSQKFSAIASI